MMKTVLRFEDKGSDEVTVRENSPNVSHEGSEIFRVTCPTGLKYSLNDGQVLMMKLYDDTKKEINRLSELLMLIKIPAQEAPIQITDFQYGSWHNVSKVDQLNVNFRETLHLKIPHGFATILEGEAFVIKLKSPDVVSWAAGDGSEIVFDVGFEPLKKA